ncbi:MAG TPA: hypothetical protein VFT72_07980 [Opitutaceae bacterium]|nr:hypothetical protein [Opitutaceae bacterium]
MPKPNRLRLRTWATPVTIGAFILMSVTGILMIFDWEHGLVTVTHQWFSWIFVVGVCAHIAINVRSFKNHLSSGWGRASMVAFVLVLGASFFSWGLITGPQLKDTIEQSLVDAPISALAGVAHVSPEDLINKFKAGGINATGEKSIRELSEEFGVSENRLLAIVFLPE